MRSKKRDSREWQLVTLMDAIARVLIKLDVTPSQWGEISRASFVKAGVSTARKKRTGTPHVARVASLTALPRNEVRKIIDSNYLLDSKRVDQLPRHLRVLAAWKATPRYLRGGKHAILRMSGRAPSFETLCKDFSGDIPHKAIATELLARNLIRLKRIGNAEYVSIVRSIRPTNAQALDMLAYIAAFLDSVASSDRILVKRKQRVVSPENLSAAYFQNSIVARVSSFIDHLPIEPTPCKRTLQTECLDVFAVVSRSPKKS
jgi:hypothetical protein